MTGTLPPDPQSQAFMATLTTMMGAEAARCIDPDKTISPHSSGGAATFLMPRPAPFSKRAQTIRQPPLQTMYVGDIPTLKAAPPSAKTSALGALPAVRTEQRQDLARWSEFTVRDRVGKGGMGEIFRAGQNALQREVAIKKIIPEHLQSAGAAAMEEAFISEALVTGYLDHPNIVPVYSLGRDDDGKWFFTMKMVRGIEWRHLLHPEKCKNEAMKAEALARKLGVGDPVQRAAHLDENLRVLLSICNAVAFAHSKKIIHRDLKPENVMVGEFGEVLVMDWGLAVDVSETPAPPGNPEHRVPSRADCGLGGTPSYMAPEQMMLDASGKYSGAGLNCWTDVFLLGGMLHEVLTGDSPYSGPSIGAVLAKVTQCNPVELPDTVPVELAAICRKAMAKNPRERFASASEFQKALSDFLRHRESAAVAAKAERESQVHDIPSLARAVVLYDQALELWPGNVRAQEAVRVARTVLALKEKSARATRHFLIAAVACIVLGLTIGFIWIRAEQGKALASMQEEKKAKDKAVTAVREQSISIARGLVAQGDAYLMASRFGQARTRYQQAWEMFGELKEPTGRAEWGMWDFYRSADTPLLTLSDAELSSGVGAVAISPDGKQALTSAPGNALRLWDMTTGIPLATLNGHTGNPICIAFSADGKRALSGSEDHTVCEWNLAESKLVRTLDFPTHLIKWVSFSTDGKQILSGGSDGALRTWDAGSGTVLREQARPNASTFAETFSPVTRHVLTGSNFNSVALWDMDTGTKIFDLQKNKDLSVFIWGVAMSSDGLLGLSGGRDKTLRLWDLQKGTMLREFNGHNAAISSAAFSGDSKLAVSASWDQTLKLWDAQTGALVADLVGHTNKVLFVAMSPDGRNVVSRGLDRCVKLWDAKARTKAHEFKGHTQGLECVAFSPNGKLAVSGGRDNRIRVWDVETGMELRRMIGYAKSAAFLPDGKRFITADNVHNVLQIWSMETGLKEREIIAPFKCCAFSDDGKFALLAGAGLMDFNSKDIKLWDLEMGRAVRSFEGSADSFYDAQISLASQCGATITIDSAMKLWNLQTGQILHTISGPFYRAAFSPDGKQIVTGNVNGDVELWDVASGTKVRDFYGHLEQVRSVAFSPDGKQIASGSDGKTVKLWDVESGTELREFKGHENAVGCIAFDPESRRILSGGDDNIIRLWDSTFAVSYHHFESELPAAQKQLALNPNDAAALNTLGEWFAFRGVHDRAMAVLERARAAGAHVSALTLGRCYEQLGEFENSGKNFDQELSRIRSLPASADPASLTARGADELHLSIYVRTMYVRNIEASKAKKDHAAYLAAVQNYLSIFEREVKTPTVLADKLNEYAWRLLTQPDTEFRDAAFALPLARRAVDMTKESDPSPLDVLALALFRNGRRDEALVAIKKAIAILPTSMLPAQRKEYEDQLKEIEDGK